MTNVDFNINEFSKTFKNALDYSNGFFKGADINRKVFNEELGKYTTDVLSKFIDSKARANPDSLHHVYEWGAIGSPSSRLFEINSEATKTSIFFKGSFLPSSSISDNSNEPFTEKANIMENSIAIEVSPKSSNVLAFEADGDTVFTMDSIYISNPGGNEVAGSFARAVEDFFENYFTNTILFQSGIFQKISHPKEFSDNFVAGAMGGGFGSGFNAGKKYFSFRGAQ
jgi:hypothetical protein